MPNETEIPQIDPIAGLKALSEASSSSLDEFFSKDPLHLQDKDISLIVEEYRKMRQKWITAELAGKKSLSKTQIPKALQSVKPSKDIEF